MAPRTAGSKAKTERGDTAVRCQKPSTLCHKPSTQRTPMAVVTVRSENVDVIIDDLR